MNLADATTEDLIAELERRRPVHEPIEFLKCITAVSMYYKIQCEHIRSTSRLREHVTPKHVAMYLCAQMELGRSAVARFFRMDHTAILFAVKKVRKSRALLNAAAQIRKRL